jgi:hypothetical protein
MATGYVSYAAPVATGRTSLGVTNQPSTTAPATVTPPVANQQAVVNTPNAQVATGFSSTPAATSGGGVLGDIGNAIASGINGIAQMAQSGMAKLEQQMNGEMSANGGQMDAAKVQMYSQKMSAFEMVMQLAAKLQESKDNATRAWLR